MWNEKNHRLFSNNFKSIMQLIEKVKITTLSWLKAKNVCFPFGLLKKKYVDLNMCTPLYHMENLS